MTIPTTEPTVLAAGDLWEWTRSVPGYPASAAWELSYVLHGADRMVLAFTGVAPEVTAVGDGFAVSVPAAKTAPLAPGTYRWHAYVTKAAARYLVDQGVITVLANFATAAAGSLQTWAEKTLAVVEAILEGRITADVASYQVAGRTLAKESLAELHKLRNRLRAEVDAERHPGRFGIDHVATFRDAS